MTAAPHRLLKLLPVLLVAGFVALTAGTTELATFVTDLLWFRELGQEGVFWKTLTGEWGTGLAFGAAFFVFLYGNVRLARAMAPRVQVVSTSELRAQMEVALAQLRERLNPYVEVLLLLGSAVLAFGAGAAASGEWMRFQLAVHAVPFGQTDPQFGRDIGFFVFHLPALRYLTDWLLGVLGVTVAASALVHLFDGAIRPWDRWGGFEPHVKGHLSVLLGLIASAKVLDYSLRVFELAFSPRGTVVGASYTDVYAQIPALRILTVVAALAALALLVNIRFRGWKLPAVALGVWVAASVLVGNVYPALVQQFRVSPNEVAAEAPFIRRNIDATRKAFDLDSVEVKPFAVAETLSAADLEAPENRETLENARLWDPAVVVQSYKQLQEIRFYYDFNDVDIDRYTVDGRRRQVLVSVRELNPQQLSEQARTWVNQHLVYTHGYGAVVSPVDEASPDGLPTFLVKDIPPVTATDLRITQPAVYFGEETTTYVIAPTALPEFDYPLGDKNAFKSYDGKAGVPVGGFFTRALFALRFGSAKILLSEYIRPTSRVLFARSLGERMRRLAPWLALDRDPYPAIVGGRIVWILDGYTTSDHYPYSQPAARGLNYIRNSVKVTVDAYDGTTTLYAFDPTDPVLAAWRGVFPGLFADASTIPDAVRSHLRYPADLFRLQAEVYKTYHMLDPQVFYNKEDQWAIPGERGDGGPGSRAMEPFYVLMRLPGSQAEQFMLMLPFTPRNKDNMIGWMAAVADPERYGKRLVYTFPKQRLVLGPQQVSARINQDPTISPELTLWNQRGSSVLFGNLLVLPVKDSIVYIQPLYLQAEQTAMPALTRVIVAYADRIAMEKDLPSALARVFGRTAGAPSAARGASPASAGAAGPALVASPGGDLAAARDLYRRALDAQRAGDWAAYGRHIGELGQVLERLAPGRGPTRGGR